MHTSQRRGAELAEGTERTAENRRLVVGIDASRAMRPRRTGTERYSLEIVRHLLALDADNVEWRLYTSEPVPRGFFDLPDQDAPQQPPPDVRILTQSRLWTHRKLAREIAASPPDVLFVPAHVLPWRPPGRTLPPSVVTIHDLGYHYFPEAHTRQQRAYLEWSTRYAVKHATRLIAVSQATAADLQRLYHADPAKIDVVHEACEPIPHMAQGEIAATFSELGISRPYALFVGTLQPRKNLVRLVDAYAKVIERDSTLPFDLVLAGARGWLSDSLFAAIDAHNLRARIHLPGAVSDTQLYALLRGAHLFVFPSLFEGFGLPILEAQSAGVPVMTANNSSLPEVAGEGALYVDPTDVDAIAAAMLRLSTDEALRAQLIAAGHENVKRFSWSHAAQQTLEVLRNAAESGKK